MLQSCYRKLTTIRVQLIGKVNLKYKKKNEIKVKVFDGKSFVLLFFG